MKLVCYEFIVTKEFLRQAEDAEQHTTDLMNMRLEEFFSTHPELIADGDRQLQQIPIRQVATGPYPVWEPCDVVDATAYKYTVIQPATEA